MSSIYGVLWYKSTLSVITRMPPKQGFKHHTHHIAVTLYDKFKNIFILSTM